MRIPSLVTAASLGLMFLFTYASSTQAAEVRVLSSGGLRSIMEDLGPRFERMTGHTLTIVFANASVAMKRVQAGETFDIAIIPQPLIDRFVQEGKAVAGSMTAVARSGMGVAVGKGAPKPDISSPEAFRRTLLAAKSINYPNPAFGGAAGRHFAKVLERLDIADEVKSKTVFAPKAGMAGALVADGTAEIGVYLIQELITVDGIDFVGPLPRDLQYQSVVAAALMTGARDAEAFKALLNFLRTPEAQVVIKAKGLEPAAP